MPWHKQTFSTHYISYQTLYRAWIRLSISHWYTTNEMNTLENKLNLIWQSIPQCTHYCPQRTQSHSTPTYSNPIWLHSSALQRPFMGFPRITLKLVSDGESLELKHVAVDLWPLCYVPHHNFCHDQKSTTAGALHEWLLRSGMEKIHTENRHNHNLELVCLVTDIHLVKKHIACIVCESHC